MQSLFRPCVLTFVLLTATGLAAGQALPAFPGAEGEGKWATGGRGGDVYHVTNLNDSGAGSLRYGIDTSGEARTIVFDTGGTIHLTSGGLFINSDNITIAGQTAPGDGICIIGHGLALDDADDIIIRHIRVRPGDIEEGAFSGDAIGFRICDDIIFDHVSASWGIDETLSPTKCPSNCTIQWCIISEGLNCTPYHDKDPCHGCGTLCRAQYRDCYITFHHNIWAHQEKRSPRLGSYDDVTLWCDFRYNLLYNYGTSYPGSGCVQGAADGERCNLNYVGNYIVRGPDSDGGTYAFKGWEANHMDIYQSGNKIDGDCDNNKDGSDTGWGMFDGDYDAKVSPFSMEAVSADTADNAADDVRDYAGATLPSRDSVDARVVADIWDDDGDIIDSQDDVGGYPAYATGSAPTDTDRDGMPDNWELWYGTNPATADNNAGLGPYAYTNLEQYLQWLIDTDTVSHPGDANRNDAVSIGDLAIMAGHWDMTGMGWEEGDFNNDGHVSIGDLAIMAGNWNWSWSGEPIPEPATIGLMLLGWVGLARKRRT